MLQLLRLSVLVVIVGSLSLLSTVPACSQTIEAEVPRNKFGQVPEEETKLASLPPGINILAATGLEPLKERVADGVSHTVREVAVDAMPFERAMRVTTPEKPENRYDIQLVSESVIPLQIGDVGLATFYARAVEAPSHGGPAKLDFLFERNGPPWTTSVSTYLDLDTQWKRYYFPFRVRRSMGSGREFPPGDLRVTFNFGFAPQTVEIADLQVVHFPERTDVQGMPVTRFTYAGSEPDAAWRAEAERRIAELRQGDIALEVVDEDGQPMVGAEVRVRMLEHDFPFGSTVNAGYLINNADTEDGQRYRHEILELFNYASTENCLKWRQWRDNPQLAMEAVAWLNDHGLPVHGHVLVWPSFTWSPWRGNEAAIQKFTDNPPILQHMIEEHVSNIVRTMKGQLVEWDVMNEPYGNHIYMDLLGEDVMVDWFQIAHRGDPGARLFINDYGILACSGNPDDPHLDHYEKTIRYLLDNGAPLQGIGLQSHFAWEVTEPETLLEILDRFGAFGLPLAITEYDHNITDEALQAVYIRDFMTVIFSHPEVQSFNMWGFWDGRHWLDNAPLYRTDWSLKPSGEVFKELVFGKWWTPDQTGTIGEDGEFGFRGFWGRYSVEVGGKSGEVDVTTGREGTVRVVVE